MQRLFLAGPMFIVFLNGVRVRLINMSLCDLILTQEDNPNAELAIVIGNKRATARAKDLRLIP